VISLNLDSLF